MHKARRPFEVSSSQLKLHAKKEKEIHKRGKRERHMRSHATRGYKGTRTKGFTFYDLASGNFLGAPSSSYAGGGALLSSPPPSAAPPAPPTPPPPYRFQFSNLSFLASSSLLLLEVGFDEGAGEPATAWVLNALVIEGAGEEVIIAVLLPRGSSPDPGRGRWEGGVVDGPSDREFFFSDFSEPDEGPPVPVIGAPVSATVG
jgi:hypothetical protein